MISLAHLSLMNSYGLTYTEVFLNDIAKTLVDALVEEGKIAASCLNQNDNLF
jgi:hypothetical protein